MNAGGSCEKCWCLSFFDFLRPDLSPDTGKVFSGSTVPPDSNKTELGSSDWEASPSAVKNNRVVLVPCLHMEVHPYSISGCVDISEVPGCHLIRQMSSQWGLQKLLQGLIIHEITAYLLIFNQFKLNEWIMAIYKSM